jgi:hypothetical protein
MNMKITSFTPHQLGALITLFVIAVWGVLISWLNMTKPLGLLHEEILILSVIVTVYVILLPFYVLGALDLYQRYHRNASVVCSCCNISL